MFGITYRIVCFVPAIAGLLVFLAQSAEASEISYVDAYGNIIYDQTSNSSPVTPTGAFYSADLNSTIAGAYTSASFTNPGRGSPQSLTETSPSSTDYHFQTGDFVSLSAMEAAYPFGTYTFSGVNGSTTDTASFTYSADDYTTSIPYLTGTDYTSLQGMNPSQAFTFDFSPFNTGSTANFSYIFFTIYDQTTGGNSVFDEGFLDPTTGSLVLPAGTLTPGNTYEYEIDYSNRDIVSGSGSAEFPPELGFDVRTNATFTTSTVPEPRSYGALLVAFVGILILRGRSKSSARSALRLPCGVTADR